MRFAPHRSNKFSSPVVSVYGAAKATGLPRLEHGGEGGIRTLDTLLGYGALAKRCFRPLSHLTNNVQEYDEQLPVANSMREIRRASNFAPIQRQSDSRERPSNNEFASADIFSKASSQAVSVDRVLSDPPILVHA